jgi:hypothetical protein
LVPENVDADDDSSTWAAYENQLNFTTFAQSLYTLFQLSVLGSWNMVASTAAKKFPTSSFLFFYSYRLFMTLTVMPILFSFIIQIFIIRRDLEEQSKHAASVSVEETDERESSSMARVEQPRGPPTSSVVLNVATDLPLDSSSGADEVSSFLFTMVMQHPEIDLRRNSLLRRDSQAESERSRDSKQNEDTLENARRSRKKTRISALSDDQETEMMGTMWSSDPMLLKRRPPEVLESENKQLREHLATALQLLHDQKIKAIMEEQMSKGMKEFIERGLDPKEV